LCAPARGPAALGGGPAVLCQQLDAEAAPQRLHVVEVHLAERVAGVAADLHLRGDAADRPAGDDAPAGEAAGLADPHLAVLHRVVAVAVVVEDDRVHVDPAVAVVAQHEAGRRPAPRQPEPPRGEHLPQARDVVQRDQQVQVVVRAGLLAEQRVDAPAAVDEPHGDAVLLERPDHGHDVRGGHHRPSPGRSARRLAMPDRASSTTRLARKAVTSLGPS
jgi:hypothetical protein